MRSIFSFKNAYKSGRITLATYKILISNKIRDYIYKGYLYDGFDEILGDTIYCAAEECGSTEEEVQMIKDSFCNFSIYGILTIIDEDEEEYSLKF